jgi:hypothetical protein
LCGASIRGENRVRRIREIAPGVDDRSIEIEDDETGRRRARRVIRH